MFNSGEFSKILDEIFEKDEKEKEKAIKIYCKIWEYLENITLQNLKYKRAFEILKPIINMDNNIEEGGKEYWLSDIWGLRKLTKEQYELLEELINK